MHSLNKVDDNIAKIGQFFPNSLTERKNEKGEVEYAIDFDVLRQELSSVIMEGNETVTNCHQFKIRATDGKMRLTDRCKFLNLKISSYD